MKSFRVIHLTAPSWLMPQINLAVYSEVVVSIYCFTVSFKSILKDYIEIMARDRLRNNDTSFALSFKNQPRWPQLQTTS